MWFKRDTFEKETEVVPLVWACEKGDRWESVEDGGGNGGTWKEASVRKRGRIRTGSSNLEGDHCKFNSKHRRRCNINELVVRGSNYQRTPNCNRYG